MNPSTSNQESKAVYVPRWKRILDVTFILLVMPIILPLAIVIGVVIALSSPGPVLFRQERVGLCGRRFMCLKFRTMFVGAETVSHQGHLKNLIDSDAPMTKLDARGDSRIIPLGAILRSSGLDELPQLINVLRGEMSLVGPRPCLPYEMEKYLPWQLERFDTLPGLTGLWQVNGKNHTTFNEMMQLDIEYVRRKNFWMDSGIILKTLPVMAGEVLESRHRKKILRTAPIRTAAVPRVERVSQ